MEPSTKTPNEDNGSCSGGPTIQPCACCAALAQLRMPWMDTAIQHAAPHYPYYQSYPASRPHPGAQQSDSQLRSPLLDNRPDYQKRQSAEPGERLAEQDSEDSESKTLFFKLPGLGRSKKSRQAGRQVVPPSAGNGRNNRNESSISPKTPSPSASANGSPDPDQCKSKDGSSDKHSERDSDACDLKDDGAGDSDWQAETAGTKRVLNLAFGLKGLAVSLAGVAIPSLVLVAGILSTPKRFTLVALHHPIETLVEFSLVAAIPIVNYLVWSAICKNRVSLSRAMVMALGASIGSALVVAGISFAGLFLSGDRLASSIGSDFGVGFTWLGLLSLMCATVSAYLANRLRLSWELPGSRLKVTTQAVTGLILSLAAFAVSEYRPWCIRLAQYDAVSSIEKVRVDGLARLRRLCPEREMRMECADSRAAGLPGLFLPVKMKAQHQLYFTLTGTPYSFRDEKANDAELSSMSDLYLSRHVVGDQVPHFSLTRSKLDGVLHANTLTSTLNWTFIVKNDNSYPLEMRAELGLPSGAAVTGLTLWRRGESSDAEFVASGKIDGVRSVTADGQTPAMVTDLGRGRVLLHCYPVPAEEEMMVRVSMVVPLKSEIDGLASVVTPQLIASNFDLEGEHTLRLRSKTALSSTVKGLTAGTIPGGETTMTGKLTTDQLQSSPLLVTAKRMQTGKPYAVLDRLAMDMRREEEKERERIRVEKEKAKEAARQREAKEELKQVVLMIDGSRGMKAQLEGFSKILTSQRQDKKKLVKPKIITIKPEYVLEDISRTAAPAPKQLIVVIDGSASMKEHGKELSKAMANLPRSIPTKVIVASQEKEGHRRSPEATALGDILPQLEKLEFVGGQDNLESVVAAAGLAGETKGSAVLWIHGPQPVINQEIYPISPYEAAPVFYELPVVAGTDTYEFFKNHAEIGPFIQVPRTGKSLSADLTEFFAKWNPHNNSYVPTITRDNHTPKGAVAPGPAEARELIILRAVEDCNNLIRTRHFRRAARLAVRYGFVSSVSSALVLENTDQVTDADATANSDEDSAQESDTELAGLGAPAASTNASADNAPQDAFDVTGSQSGYAASKAPQLQGATNGTIGPQGVDATVITGVNTAGTVRVNNLANLEALLNILANLGELAGLGAGLLLVINGLVSKAVVKLGEDIELGRGGRVTLGVILMVAGLTLPGIINWFVASARDANLFS